MLQLERKFMSKNNICISTAISNCYDNLEKIEILTILLQEKFLGDKTVDVIFDIISSNIRNATENILEIQNALPKLLS